MGAADHHFCHLPGLGVGRLRGVFMTDTDFEALDPEGVEIPTELPLLPVRDIVVFPYMVLPLFVGQGAQ